MCHVEMCDALLARIMDAADVIRNSELKTLARFTRGRVRELKNAHNSVTVQNRTHVYVNFFDHTDLGNHLLQLCPKVMKHPVYIYIYT